MREENRFHNDIFRANILSHIKTDNILLDIMIGGLLMTFMNKFIDWISRIQIPDKIQSYFRFNKKKNEILISRKEYVSTNHWDAKNTYPKSILAIHNYINKNNLVKNGSMKYIDYKFKQISDMNYVIDTTTPIQLTKDIYFEMVFSENGKTIVENNKGEKTIEHKYSLYSYNKTLIELTDFLNHLMDELDQDIIYQLNKKPFYFMFDRRNDDTVIFDEYSLENDRTFDNIFFDEKTALKNRLDFFMNNREWYSKKGIPYTLGLMFSGKPGCGKTSTIKAIAKYTKRHIIDIPLNKIDSCRELMTIFYGDEINGKKIPMNKRIYLFEDIDTIIDVLKEREKEEENKTDLEKIAETIIQTNEMVAKRSSPLAKMTVKQNDKLNLGFFLNLIDGVLETPGRILILSTNYPDKLDKALVRPGRIDMKIHLEKCSSQMIRDILGHYYEDYEENEDIVAALFEKGITPAELYQLCFKYGTFKKMIQCIEEEGLDTLFGKIIDRRQEELLEKEKDILYKQHVKRKRFVSDFKTIFRNKEKLDSDGGEDEPPFKLRSSKSKSETETESD